MVLDCEGLTMKSRMGIIGRGYDGGRVALLRKAQAHPDYEKYMKLASSR
jgi:hypothetical protein